MIKNLMSNKINFYDKTLNDWDDRKKRAKKRSLFTNGL